MAITGQARKCRPSEAPALRGPSGRPTPAKKRLCPVYRFLSRLTITHDTGKLQYLGQRAPVIFFFDFDG